MSPLAALFKPPFQAATLGRRGQFRLHVFEDGDFVSTFYMTVEDNMEVRPWGFDYYVMEKQRDGTLVQHAHNGPFTLKGRAESCARDALELACQAWIKERTYELPDF